MPTLANILLYGATILIVYRLTILITNESIARLSTFLVTIWPNYIASAGLASKEMVLVPLLPLAILLYLLSTRAIGWKNILFLVLTGLVLGSASLTQPSLLLFPTVLIFYELLRRENTKNVLPKFVVILIGMGFVIGPWTVRKYTVLNAWVPISSNGGYNFYRANNPRATGGYVSEGERNLDYLDEVQRNKVGYQLGKEWIFKNPADFLILALQKQILFLGDDSSDIYETLKRGSGINDVRYLLLKGLSNLYWWGDLDTHVINTVAPPKIETLRNP